MGLQGNKNIRPRCALDIFNQNKSGELEIDSRKSRISYCFLAEKVFQSNRNFSTSRKRFSLNYVISSRAFVKHSYSRIVPQLIHFRLCLRNVRSKHMCRDVLFLLAVEVCLLAIFRSSDGICHSTFYLHDAFSILLRKKQYFARAF